MLSKSKLFIYFECWAIKIIQHKVNKIWNNDLYIFPHLVLQMKKMLKGWRAEANKKNGIGNPF